MQSEQMKFASTISLDEKAKNALMTSEGSVGTKKELSALI